MISVFLREQKRYTQEDLVNEFRCSEEKTVRILKRLKEYGIRYQLLHAYRLVFPQIGGKLSDLSEKVILSPLPEVFGQLR